MSSVIIKCALPPSSNNAYQNLQRGGRKKSTDAKNWQRDFQWLLKAAKYKGPETKWTAGNEYSLTLVFYAPHSYWYTKAGGAQRHDVTNYVKLAEDAIAKYLGFDDRLFWESHSYKKTAEEFAIEVIIE